jgi:subtilisin
MTLGRPLLALVALAVSASAALAARPADGDYLVRFSSPPGQAEAAMINGLGGKVKRQFKIVPAFAVSLPAPAVEALSKRAGVAAIEPDGQFQAHDDYSSVWGVRRIYSPQVHDGSWVGSSATPIPVTGSGIRVAVMDTGIDGSHPELAANYRGGYDFVNNDNDPFDDHWHGTHVAGTIAAVLNGSGVAGVAPDVELYGIKVLSSTGSGSFSWVISGLDWCVANNIDVVNLSLGASGNPGSTVEAAFDNAWAAGVVIMASAGNSGAGTDTVGWPAQYGSAIAIASTTSADARSSFSSTGPAVELAAPGSSIFSTYPGNSYATASGTSMACPHAAGAAALVIAGGIVDDNGDGRINDEVRAALQVTALDLGSAGRDQEFGYGLIDVAAAVLISADTGDGGGGGGDPPPVFDAPTNLTGTAAGNVVSLTWSDNSNVETGYQVQYGLKVKKNITWETPIDLPANTSATELTLPSGSYRIRVRAVKDAELTAWSDQLSISVGGGGKKGGGGGGGGGGGKGRK